MPDEDRDERLKRWKALVVSLTLVVSVSLLGLLAPSSSAESLLAQPDGGGDYCPASQIRDFTAPIQALPTISTVPKSGRLPFGPSSYRLSGDSGLVTSGDPIGFELRSVREMRDSPGWNLKLELQKISAVGKDIGMARSRAIKISKKIGPSAAPLTIRLRPGPGSGFIRTKLTIRDGHGTILKVYEEYLRKMKPTGKALLVGIVHENPTQNVVAFRVLNTSTFGMTTGRGAAIEELVQGHWQPVPGPERFVGQIAIDTEPGFPGPCESISLPPDQHLGPYRLRKRITLGSREVPLTFTFNLGGQ